MITLRYVDSSEEQGDRGALRAAENLVDIRLARSHVPQARGSSFTDKCVPAGLVSDFKLGPSSTALPECFAAKIHVPTKLLLEITHHLGRGDQVFARLLTSKMLRDTIRITVQR